jgi:hypothetical protein
VTAFAAPQELHDLAFRYALAVDSLDTAMLASVFTSDGVLRGHGENPIEFRGAEGLARMVGQCETAFQKTMHNVFNHVLRGDDWKLLDMAMRYHNLYSQEDGVWKFAERRLEVVWVETRPVQKFTSAMMDADLKEFR